MCIQRNKSNAVALKNLTRTEDLTKLALIVAAHLYTDLEKITNVWSSIAKSLVLRWTMIYIITFTVLLDRMRSTVAKAVFSKWTEVSSSMMRWLALQQEEIIDWIIRKLTPECIKHANYHPVIYNKSKVNYLGYLLAWMSLAWTSYIQLPLELSE